MTLPASGTSSSSNVWWPRGIPGWLVAGLAIAVVVGLAALAFAMVYPVPFDNPLGLCGAVALFFPLHLLAVAAVAAGLAAAARGLQKRLAAVAFASAALLSAAMGLWPSVALWHFARQQDVVVSLGDYFANAAHLNLGSPQRGRSVVYWTAADGTKLLLDVWAADDAAGGALRPALVRMHGGAFIGGNRSDMPDWDRWFNSLGYTVFDIEYRLPPPVRWLDEVGDVKCALGWVVAHAGEYAIDPARISVTGFSAGANLAMLAAYSVGDRRLPPSCDVPPVAIRSVINFYGDTNSTTIYWGGFATQFARAKIALFLQRYR